MLPTQFVKLGEVDLNPTETIGSLEIADPSC